ncbi:hypothetical protein KP509_1Z278600 [Ceratopteris richardii]|nr:hypothetical protein KP509_1Z278600 [Ceratopteris richardii]
MQVKVHQSKGTPPTPLWSGTTPVPPPIMPPSPAPEPSQHGVSNRSQGLSVFSLCNSTDQSKLCLEVLSDFPSSQPVVSLLDLTTFVAGRALAKLNETYALAMNLSRSGEGNQHEKAALQDCLELFDEARDGLVDSIDKLSHMKAGEDPKLAQKDVMDVRVWLSASNTQQDTCWEGFDGIKGKIKDKLLQSGNLVAPRISIGLDLAQILQEVGLSTYYKMQFSAP